MLLNADRHNAITNKKKNPKKWNRSDQMKWMKMRKELSLAVQCVKWQMTVCSTCKASHYTTKSIGTYVFLCEMVCVCAVCVCIRRVRTYYSLTQYRRAPSTVWCVMPAVAISWSILFIRRDVREETHNIINTAVIHIIIFFLFDFCCCLGTQQKNFECVSVKVGTQNRLIIQHPFVQFISFPTGLCNW